MLSVGTIANRYHISSLRTLRPLVDSVLSSQINQFSKFGALDLTQLQLDKPPLHFSALGIQPLTVLACHEPATGYFTAVASIVLHRKRRRHVVPSPSGWRMNLTGYGSSATWAATTRGAGKKVIQCKRMAFVRNIEGWRFTLSSSLYSSSIQCHSIQLKLA